MIPAITSSTNDTHKPITTFADKTEGIANSEEETEQLIIVPYKNIWDDKAEQKRSASIPSEIKTNGTSEDDEMPYVLLQKNNNTRIESKVFFIIYIKPPFMNGKH